MVGVVRIVGSHLGRIPNCSAVPDTMYFIGGGLGGRGALSADNTPAQRKTPLNPPPPNPPFFKVGSGGVLSMIPDFRETPPPVTPSICLLRMSGSWATSVASYHRALAKGDEATHSPRSWETKGSRKLLAPVKRMSVILSSRRVSREKGITRATQGKKEVGSGVSGGT